jgi:hypothetical protein
LALVAIALFKLLKGGLAGRLDLGVQASDRSNPQGTYRLFSTILMVGAAGLEPATSCV